MAVSTGLVRVEAVAVSEVEARHHDEGAAQKAHKDFEDV